MNVFFRVGGITAISRKEERCTVYSLFSFSLTSSFRFRQFMYLWLPWLRVRGARGAASAESHLSCGCCCCCKETPFALAVFFLFAPSLLQSLSILRACVPAREFLRKQSKGGAAENEFRRAPPPDDEKCCCYCEKINSPARSSSRAERASNTKPGRTRSLLFPSEFICV